MYTLPEIAARFGGEVRADNGVTVRQVASLASAGVEHIAFLTDARYLPALADTRAGAVLVPPKFADATVLPRIVTANPYAYYAKVAALLNPEAVAPKGIADSARVDSSAVIAATASIGANAVIAEGAIVGENVVVGSNCVVGPNVRIGAGTILNANVTIYRECSIGERCIVHAGAVIGADGFGHAPDNGTWVKIPQIGRVVIGNDVEVGANTTIDRGALDDTVIEDGVKLDNLIQIGHNCRIGEHTVIAGCVGIAGSAIIGKHCRIGGAAMILGHLEIADEVTISPGSMITRSVVKSGTYTALMPFQPHREWLTTAAHIRHLDALVTRIGNLENELKQLKGNQT
ncbi:UDP-3-O-[3-hydroxymyristoyl] glucosamine N-acyltransferase [Novimethylophilus kurashikiensis]|uniref:UDP-3-O-acylglucosamine N-acyltransferase n=1 Tax=Novimethylophilus kurashikiensis TaxID=1825523 RepID=A0A2R5F5X6_9PROT|nr:UDP-3-O-(3-hydroxymyristoyl)glucosamine N-acyltransferase [Novimethylophilus kurashikiensis]GBG13018.1 UDP-3-O-[3-hydroxymyristoyl] glucosamine N-acyltransferase [Novimethylophilus kurashikiensis]